MDPVWIAIAFALGFVARQLGQPPLVGYLAAGFVLHAVGVESDETLDQIADLGIYLLLFGIGLKLRIRSLLRPQIWAVASTHMMVTVLVFTGILFGIAALGLSRFTDLDFLACALLAFAASFSSTVFAVKVLEEKGEMESLHGRMSIGVLIMQDLIAVVFLTLSAGKTPSVWAFALLALIAIRPILFWVMKRAGHGELLVLFGWLVPLAGAAVFSEVGLKPDLGALLLGAMLASHPKAGEMAKALLSFKDLFLIGFFLTIGLTGAPDLESLGIAVFLVLLLPLKAALFFALFTRLHLRARTATISSISLANYSEFGLIVGAVGSSNGWISREWLVILAVALSLSFIIAAPLKSRVHDLYVRWDRRLRKFESAQRLPEERPVEIGDAEVLILGMGQVGTAVYEEMCTDPERRVVGVEFDEELVRSHREVGRNVVLGDATDFNFWERVERRGTVPVAVLTMADHRGNLDVLSRLSTRDCVGQLLATARHQDQVEELEAAGATMALDFYTEAGIGLAEHVRQALPGQ
jgi:glutathione-regulated potassium-efflux system ancillary protein KefC